MSSTTLHLPTATRIVHIAADGANLTGELTIPPHAIGLVVFCRTNTPSTSARGSRRVANALLQAGFGTLVFDLLTPDEELIDSATCHLRSDRALLARRLIHAIDWLASQPGADTLPLGLYGEGPGGAAALIAACVRSKRVRAIVSHAGRPDLASPVLGRVRAPVLLVACGNDADAARANASAFPRLNGRKELVLVDSATRLLENVDTLGEVVRLTVGWFARHVVPEDVAIEPTDEFC
jgi:putative phosphoribosyl transferase